MHMAWERAQANKGNIYGVAAVVLIWAGVIFGVIANLHAAAQGPLQLAANVAGAGAQ